MNHQNQICQFQRIHPPKKIAISGASSQICTSISFRIASGQLAGQEQMIDLYLYDSIEMEDAVKGLQAEIQDSAFPLVGKIVVTTNKDIAFRDAEFIFLCGSKLREPSVLKKNHSNRESSLLYQDYGKSISNWAKRDCRVLVVGNPPNTNCLISCLNSQSLPKHNFSALSRLDHNRAKSVLALKTESLICDVSQVAVWGNSSSTIYPDLRNTKIRERQVLDMVESKWITDEFIPSVQNRAKEIIQLKKIAPASSVGKAAVDQMREWVYGSDDWQSLALYNDREGQKYTEVPEGLIFSFPCQVDCHGYVQYLDWIEINDEISSKLIKATVDELLAERQEIEDLLP
ncbi:hypothetical protein FGO68_gene4233 [Halteria grandinella]|uniref:malate dehydrogenase n=1 Tax=Halteria grandinella TaxID=5974 RepID=A0A8J8T0G6_HALGN|nr:hypothetical protein FGO68_gene4233 [Halteria grandinella]